MIMKDDRIHQDTGTQKNARPMSASNSLFLPGFLEPLRSGFSPGSHPRGAGLLHAPHSISAGVNTSFQ